VRERDDERESQRPSTAGPTASEERAPSEPEVQRLQSLVARLRAERDSLRQAVERLESAPATGSAGTRDSLEAHLRDVQKLAGLGVLARAVAHDFNNHLTSILGNCSLAQSDLDSRSPVHQRLTRVREAAQHSAALTEQLLTYAGSPASSAKSIHLPHLLSNMRPLLTASVGRRCELIVESPAKLPLLEADETQLQQVIVNLLTNAAESLERKPGHAWIRLGVERADGAAPSEGEAADEFDDGDFLFMEVQDDGSGIRSEDRGRVFEPFFTTRGAGRGLGLAAVLAIVQSYGGTVELNSTPGLGTTVRVRLPRRAPRNPVPAS
jgi:two-component system cell cycle sensor histidine kinase/response regulator CckA